MKKAKVILIATLLLGSSNAFAAGWCGGGKILEIKEGGWASNDFLIRIDYSTTPDGVGGKFNGYIRFLDTLNDNRMKGIKALAYMAFTGNKDVKVWTANATCDQATDLSIFAPGAS